MPLQLFPTTDDLKKSDYELGVLLLDDFVAAEATNLGIPTNQIPEEFTELVREHILMLEANAAKDAALEKALHKAAGGDFETAGRILREHVVNGAIAVKFIPIGIAKSEQAVNFGKEGSKARTEIGTANRRRILSAATKVLESRNKRKPSMRELARLIKTETKIPVETVRGHLKGYVINKNWKLQKVAN